MEFVTAVVLDVDDRGITTYLELVVGARYRYQHRLNTDDQSESVSLVHLMMSMFHGERNPCDVRYVDVMETLVVQKTTMHKGDWSDTGLAWK